MGTKTLSDTLYVNGATFGGIATKTTSAKTAFTGSANINVAVGDGSKSGKDKKAITKFNSIAEHMTNDLNKVYQKKD